MKTVIKLAAAASILWVAACAERAKNDAGESATGADESAAPDGAEVSEPAAISEAAADLSAGSSNADAAPPADGEERFYGKESFTIVSAQTGTESGDFVEHVRDWGRNRAEIKKTTLKFGSFTTDSATRTIYEGARVTTVDLKTGAVTSFNNGQYDAIVARMKGRSGVEFGKEIMTALGGVETGETGSFAGHDCVYWELASLGSRTCVTPWGGSLHTSASLAGVTFEKTAIEVRMGDGGPDDAFAYDASKAQEQPDPSELLKRLGGGE
jgi:hypothetical protein